MLLNIDDIIIIGGTPITIQARNLISTIDGCLEANSITHGYHVGLYKRSANPVY